MGVGRLFCQQMRRTLYTKLFRMTSLFMLLVGSAVAAVVVVVDVNDVFRTVCFGRISAEFDVSKKNTKLFLHI